jgi:hypothetical protein
MRVQPCCLPLPFQQDVFYGFLQFSFSFGLWNCICLWILSTMFTLCPFKTKMGSIFIFWIGNVFLTGQVIFVPEWPNREFVSLYWLHSV